MTQQGYTEFRVKDGLGERTLIIPPNELAWAGDPTEVILDIEARTRTRLKDGGNPAWFIRLALNFKERVNPNDGVSFTESVERRHPQKIDIFPEPRKRGDDALPNPMWYLLGTMVSADGRSPRSSKPRSFASV